MNRARNTPKFWKTRLGRRLALAGTAAAILLLGRYEVFGPNGFLALRQKQAEFGAEHTRLVSLQHENQQLHQSVKQLKSDPNEIERIAREQLHLTRPGEVVYTYPKH